MFTDLGTLGGGESLAFDVNNGGHIAGVARTAADEVHGFLWTDGVMRDLGPVAFVLGINNRDQVVGAAFAPSGQLQAFVWSGGSVTFLGHCPVPATALPRTSTIEGKSSDGRVSPLEVGRSCGTAG